MKTVRRSPNAAIFLLSLAAALPSISHAHRGWLLPSSTVISSADAWVTVDAAVSNDLFFFDHRPMRLNELTVTAPDGSAVIAENQSTGTYRSTFDVKLAQPGTYRISIGGAAPRRVETFVTAGKPNDKALQPKGAGLEFIPVTHPNDLFAGENATFGFTLDGKPAEGLTVTVIPGGIRYRDQLHEMKFTTDKDGKFSVKWPEPGMYWLNTSIGGPPREGGSEAPNNAPRPAPTSNSNTPGAQQQGSPPNSNRARPSYSVTLEVLAP